MIRKAEYILLEDYEGQLNRTFSQPQLEHIKKSLLTKNHSIGQKIWQALPIEFINHYRFSNRELGQLETLIAAADGAKILFRTLVSSNINLLLTKKSDFLL